jgi:hypothetical protein
VKRAAPWALLIACACTSSPAYLSKDKLLDPASCEACHTTHYVEWSRSMHAYASDDPVFLAMNARGQRETKGALGNFCIKCHAPMAVVTGASTDGLNLASLPRAMKGVTCFFCHTADSVTDSHNGAVHLTDDLVMRAEISDPIGNSAHASVYSPIHDRTKLDSASLCGSCHDIVTPLGAPLERTYQEWQTSVFAMATASPDPLTCGNCHMQHRTGYAAPGDMAIQQRERSIHNHVFPAVDTTLTGTAPPPMQVAEIAEELKGTVQAQLCVEEIPEQRVYAVLDNTGAGHHWPSGATQDRRAWVELTAYKNGQVLFQSPTSTVSSTTAIESIADPNLWLIRDCIYDQSGAEVSMFWQAAHVRSNQLPEPTTANPADPAFYRTHVTRPYDLSDIPDRVTMRVHLEPIARSVLDSLVKSGDLDTSYPARMRRFDVPVGPQAVAQLEWTEAAATVGFTDRQTMLLCVSTTGNLAPVITTTTARSQRSCAP